MNDSSSSLLMRSFTILLHCSIDGESGFSTTIGVLSTDSLLSVKRHIFERIPLPTMYSLHLSTGHFLLNESSTDEYLSSVIIGDFVSSPSELTSVKHIALFIAKKEYTESQITTPRLMTSDEKELLLETDNILCNNEHPCETPVSTESTVDNRNIENNNNNNGDSETLNLVYKILIFFVLVHSDAGFLSIFTLFFISALLLLNHYKLLTFCINPAPEQDHQTKESSNIKRIFNETKYIISSFVLSAFPTCIINSK